MSLVQSGTNWEVKEGFISSLQAEFAGGQAQMLVKAEADCLEELDPVEGVWAGDEMRVFKVDVAALADEDPVAVTQLVKVYERTEALARNGLGEFFLNLYGPFGSTAKHRDNHEVNSIKARATIAVGLIGVGEVELQDPSTGEVHTIVLNPGSSLHLDNSVPSPEKPIHLVRNTLEIPRIALVNG